MKLYGKLFCAFLDKQINKLYFLFICLINHYKYSIYKTNTFVKIKCVFLIQNQYG